MGFPNTYPQDCDFIRWRYLYPTFEQLGLEFNAQLLFVVKSE